MTSESIRCEGVTKRYGATRALDDLTLQIDQPGIYCLLGRNGAGKTTLFRTLAGRTDATAGRVVVAGHCASLAAPPPGLRFVEATAPQFNLRLRDLLRYAAQLSDGFDQAYAQQLAERFELDTRKRFRQLSFGMTSMVNAILLLASDASVLLFDEPTLGFDPIVRRRFYDALRADYDDRPRTMVVATHVVDELARVASEVLVIDRGAVALRAPMTDLEERSYRLVGPTGLVEPLLADLNVLSTTTAAGLTSAAVLDRRIATPDGVRTEPQSLADLFVALVEGPDHV
ncbi:MAG: ABC transporter ATP-binding protein [Micrococcales bacterium]|nr:ABC transporter ATP-binding protein [Micrococcales bacterium]